MTRQIISIIAAAAVTSNVTAHTTEPADSFPLPTVPPALVTPSDRAAYVVSHFFDHVILPESASLGLQQSIANFTTVAPLATDSARLTAARALFSMADNPAKLNTLRNTVEDYLLGTESPFFNPDLMIPFLEADTPDPRRDELLRLVSLNRLSTPATDIPLTLTDGSQSALFDITGDAPTTLLIFFDPDCDTCHELIGALGKSKELSDAIASGRIAAVAVSAGVELASRPDFIPESWTTAHDTDGAIEENDLYFIPAIPTIYILNGSNHIVTARNLTPMKPDVTLSALGL